MNDEQDEAVRALQSGEAMGAPGPLARIDTHLSHVFLAADRAYKLKRAVRMLNRKGDVQDLWED